MTDILLVRHGETLWNQQGRMQGQQDSPLTELGVRQARLLARRLKDVSFVALYSSDLGRAYRTAVSIADETGHEIVSDVRLRERNFGIFEGLTNAEIKQRYPDHHAIFSARDPYFVMPGGESAVAFRDRCLACLAEIAARHAGEATVVVAHGLVLDAAYRAAHGMQIEQPRGFPLLNCSINTFRYADGTWSALAMCDVTHFGASDVTQFQSRFV
jgi:2,3-bisphosphoglycerate-dependent phosphoglycerate mutase